MSGNNTQFTLGGGVPGAQPQLIGGTANGISGTGMVGGSERSQTRFILRNAYGRRNWLSNALGQPVRPAIGKFRQAMNAGDLLGTVNEGPLASLPQLNQVEGSNRGGVHAGGSGYSGNPKYVYDSSDYIRFKKLQANLKLYNDSSYGGSNNGSFTFINHVRS